MVIWITVAKSLLRFSSTLKKCLSMFKEIGGNLASCRALDCLRLWYKLPTSHQGLFVMYKHLTSCFSCFLPSVHPCMHTNAYWKGHHCVLRPSQQSGLMKAGELLHLWLLINRYWVQPEALNSTGLISVYTKQWAEIQSFYWVNPREVRMFASAAADKAAERQNYLLSQLGLTQSLFARNSLCTGHCFSVDRRETAPSTPPALLFQT